VSDVETRDGDRLNALGYKQELSRVLSLFDNFSVAFSYLSPMVGIYSLYVLGFGTGGPAYIWLIPVVVLFMLCVASTFGELASDYPISGALYQYGKYNVGPRYGWYVGWIYGFALLATVASVDSGAPTYVAALINTWFGTHINPANHVTIFVIVGIFIVLQFMLNSVGAKVMGQVARLGVYVETIGTFGVFIALAIHGFTHGFSYTFKTDGVQYAAKNPFGVDFQGHWILAAFVAVLANVYIFYGFESAGDIAEETKSAQKQVPRAMRSALIYGGIASFVLVLGLVLSTPAGGPAAVVSGNVTGILSVLPSWLYDFFLVMVIIAFFSCGTAVQGAGARVAYALARDGAIPASKSIRKVSPKFKTPINALLVGSIIPFLFMLLVLVNPQHNKHILWFTWPANVNALFALVSFAVSGIYLSFFLTVLGAIIARTRGWRPSGSFSMGKWGMPVAIVGAVYLAVMLVDINWPSSITSGRALFNYGWITLLVMIAIVAIGAIYEVIARPDKHVAEHLEDKGIIEESTPAP